MSPVLSISCMIITFLGVLNGRKPNFVFILMNDLDVLLDSPLYMPNLQELIVKEGITLSNAFTSTTVDCPMRNSMIVGRYFHNVGPPNFYWHDSCSVTDATDNIFSPNSMFSILHNNGYKTGMFGKLTLFQPTAQDFCDNQTLYENVTKNAGMDRVYTPCWILDYYTTKYFDKYPNNTYQFTNLSYADPGTYQGAQIGNASLKFIENMIKQNEPFYNYIGYHNPDVSATVAEWYIDYYNTMKSKGIKAPRSPNFDVQTTGMSIYTICNINMYIINILEYSI